MKWDYELSEGLTSPNTQKKLPHSVDFHTSVVIKHTYLLQRNHSSGTRTQFRHHTADLIAQMCANITWRFYHFRSKTTGTFTGPHG